MNMNSVNRIRKQIVFVAFVGLLLVVIWIILTIFTIPSGTVQDQIVRLKNNLPLYKWSFFNASLISIPMSVLIISLAFSGNTFKERMLLNILSVFWLVPYVMLVSIAYVSQYTLFPRLLNSNSDVHLIEMLYFYNRDSFVYFFDLLGYVFLSLSAFFVGLKLILSRNKFRRGVGVLFWLMAFSALIGFTGYIMDNTVIEQGVMISGIFSIILLFLISVSGKKLFSQ